MFSRKNKSVKQANQFIWFERWVLQRRTIDILSQESGYSQRTLKTYFDSYLQQAPSLKIYPKEKLNLLIDGTYFSNDICLIVYRDNQLKFTQLYRITDSEKYEEIAEDLLNILSLGITIESITCDGHPSLLKAIRRTCKQTILQRCVVHIQRECRIYLSAKPKNFPGLELLQIVNQLHKIKTHQQSQEWMKEIIDWHYRHKEFINQKSVSIATGRYWYTHKMVRRSFVQIKNALPNMFQYLFNDHIPKSTNGLESFFGHLKSHVLMHRGLTKEHRKNFIKWYVYFRNQ